MKWGKNLILKLQKKLKGLISPEEISKVTGLSLSKVLSL